MGLESLPAESRQLILVDAAAAEALGARLAGLLSVGHVLALEGPLGAGKTTLARGLIRAWTGTDEDAPSPTYTLAQTYDGPRGPLWHMDLYRLRSPDELEELGVEDAFVEALCVVEWPERAAGRLPPDRLEIRLSLAPAGRIAQIAWRGKSPPFGLAEL